MAWLMGRLALLPLPALVLMVLGIVLTYGAQLWAERFFHSRPERQMQIQACGLVLALAGVLWVFLK